MCVCVCSTMTSKELKTVKFLYFAKKLIYIHRSKEKPKCVCRFLYTARSVDPRSDPDQEDKIGHRILLQFGSVSFPLLYFLFLFFSFYSCLFATGYQTTNYFPSLLIRDEILETALLNKFYQEFVKDSLNFFLQN